MDESIVIDNGSFWTRAGIAGEENPRSIFYTLFGKPKIYENGDKSSYIGDETKTYFLEKELSLSHPIQNGIVKDWESTELIWHHTLYNELRVSPEDCAVVLTDDVLNTKEGREKATEIMFESCNIGALHMVSTAKASISSSGRFTGLVVDIGQDVAKIIPLNDGEVVSFTQEKISNGRGITSFLSSLLENQGVKSSNFFELDIIREIKEKYCSVALNFDKIEKTSEEYTLPDGKKIKISEKEMYLPGETIFNSKLSDPQTLNLQDSIIKVLTSKECKDIMSDIVGNIYLCGGGTSIPGFEERLTQELNNKMDGVEVFSNKPSQRNISAFLGASTLGSLGSFQNMCVDMESFQEYGPSCIHSVYNQ